MVSAKIALEKWMKRKQNSHARECLLLHRLCFDLQLAAARRGYYLNTYYDDVDHDGFDVIFDDQDLLTKVQVKTSIVGGGATSWGIRRRFLRPPFDLVEAKVPISAFVEARGLDELLALMGLHSQSDSAWRHNMVVAANQEVPHVSDRIPLSTGMTLQQHKVMCAGQLRPLIICNGLKLLGDS